MAVGFPSPLVSGYVLAGGASSRMGEDKAFLKLGSRTLVEIAVAKLHQVCANVSVLSGPAGDPARTRTLQQWAGTVPDAAPLRRGPASGIAAALADSLTPWVLVLAVDQPFLPVTLLQSWVTAILASSVQASCMSLGQQVQPVPVLLHANLGPAIEQCLADGERRVRSVLECALTERGAPPLHRFVVEETEQSEGWFRNLNHPSDLPEDRLQRLSENEFTNGASEPAWTRLTTS